MRGLRALQRWWTKHLRSLHHSLLSGVTTVSKRCSPWNETFVARYGTCSTHKGLTGNIAHSFFPLGCQAAAAPSPNRAGHAGGYSRLRCTYRKPRVRALLLTVLTSVRVGLLSWGPIGQALKNRAKLGLTHGFFSKSRVVLPAIPIALRNTSTVLGPSLTYSISGTTAFALRFLFLWS